MRCERCGKALGTERAVCPFCGAALTPKQMKVFKEEKKKKQYDVDMVLERYGMAPIKYEKPQSNENKLLGLLVVLGILFILVILVLVMVLN